MNRVLASIALIVLASPALAAATDWQDVAPAARVRLISSDTRAADGTTLVGVEIDMPASTKTYWRVPGESGIPTRLDLAGSQGIAGHEVLWPYPVIDETAGFVDFVYYGPTVLPLRLALRGAPPLLVISLVMGICSDVCVPVQAQFSLPLDFGKADAGQSIRIEQAMANVPLPADKVSVGRVDFDSSSGYLSVALADTQIDPASIIAATPGDTALFGAPQKSPDTGLVLLPLLGGEGQNGLVGQPIQITFMTPRGPFAVEREIAAAGSTPDDE